MSAENPITPDEMVKQAIEVIGPVPGMNRRERRASGRAQKKAKGNTHISRIQYLEPLDIILKEEDELSLYTWQLRDYEQAQAITEFAFEYHRLFKAVDIPDSSIRAYYAREAEGNVEAGGLTSLWYQANPGKLQNLRKWMRNLESRRQSMARRNKGKLVLDEDERQVFRDFIMAEEIPIEEIYKEILRSRAESIDLIKLQIEWLEAQQRKQELPPPQQIEQSLQQEEQLDEIIPITEPEVVVEEQAYSFSNWNLFWTTTHWSQDLNHLIAIPTASREEALREFTEVSRGEVSIKPGSILRALEFHLQKDIIQRALATRIKYGPEGIRDWVKIKRGRDRIFFLVSEQERKAVFFAAGRDVVYRI